MLFYSTSNNLPVRSGIGSGLLQPAGELLKFDTLFGIQDFQDPILAGRPNLFDLILNTLFAGRSYQTYSEKIIRGDFEAGFRAALGLKDLGLARAAVGTRLPMLEAVHARMAEAVSAGLGDKDWSIMADYTLHHAPSIELKLRQNGDMTVTKMLVTCNGEPGTRMDRAYYANTHIPLDFKL